MTEPNSLNVRLQEIVEAHIKSASSIPVIGLSGPQGSGKSTALNALLESSSFNIAGLGLDDFYLPKSERQLLADTVSPLFETRGPPGTHDLALLQLKLDELLNASGNSVSRMPKFDKPSDDRLQPEDWTQFQGKPDAIIIEGWMVGAVPPPEFLTSPLLNDVESEDVGLAWRRAQYEALTGNYAELWKRMDMLIHIEGLSFENVLDWRLQQEASNLGVRLTHLSQEQREWVAYFIQHFERLTKSMHEGHRLPGIILQIDTNRDLVGFKT